MTVKCDILTLKFNLFILECRPPTQAWGEYWTKVLEYKYKYLKKWRVQVQVQVLDFEKYLSTSTSTLKSTRVQVPSTFVLNSNYVHIIYSINNWIKYMLLRVDIYDPIWQNEA